MASSAKVDYGVMMSKLCSSYQSWIEGRRRFEMLRGVARGCAACLRCVAQCNGLALRCLSGLFGAY